MCALSETKLKEKGEVMGRVSGVAVGRGGSVTEWTIDEVCNRMKGGVIQAYVG